MNDKTIELINELAVKFGTTAEHLFGVLVKQAKVAAITGIIQWSLIASLVVSLSVFLYYKTKRRTKIEHDDYRNKSKEVVYRIWEPGEPPAFFCIMGLVILFMIFLLVSVEISGTVVTALANPEYWALKQLLP